LPVTAPLEFEHEKIYVLARELNPATAIEHSDPVRTDPHR